MPTYNTEDFDPSAPVAYVTLRNPITGIKLPDVPMLIDTGADTTLLPVDAIENLDIEADKDKLFEVQGFGGEIQLLKIAHLELLFLSKKFTGDFLLVERQIGILGRNILNNLRLVLDGPNNRWDERK